MMTEDEFNIIRKALLTGINGPRFPKENRDALTVLERLYCSRERAKPTPKKEPEPERSYNWSSMYENDGPGTNAYERDEFPSFNSYD